MSKDILNELILGERPQGLTLLTASWVLGYKDGSHHLIHHGEIVIDGGKVLFIGQSFDGEVARRINFGNALISPGLIDLDALSDLDTTILGIDHHPFWAKGRVWPRSYVERGPYEMYSQEELAFQKKFAFGQLLLNGITTAVPIASLFYREWGETVAEFDAAAEAAGELGLRVFLSPAYRSGGLVVESQNKIVPVFDEERGLQGLRDAVDYISQQHGRFDGLINGMLAPDRVETCTENLLRATQSAAQELNCKIRLHMAQSQLEVDTVRALHDGKTAPAWLASTGLLNDRIIAPHATSATTEDLELYAANNVSIVHCPMVSARGGASLQSFSSCKAQGINIAMGTDTTPPDMLMNLLFGLSLSRIHDGTPTRITSADLYDAATLGGAKALGRQDIGKLEVDACADIAIFGLDDLVMAPTIDPITTLIAGGSGRVTQAVFVDGRLSMRFGEVAGINMKDARKQAQKQFDGLLNKYPERSWQHPSLQELFPPSYPILR
ncbi:amidohydrolase family protein [Paenochrobactrum glaciei]|uniref:Amidohydrolase family protein n=1 Tax=Paenochrobactrum glaciei TaxID=486407 RepID=A0ABN1GL31_9HYPH